MRARSWMVIVVALVAAACGSQQQPGAIEGKKGMTQEKARAQCEQIKESEEKCWNDQVTDECAACLMECGFSCGQAATCPIRFHCP